MADKMTAKKLEEILNNNGVHPSQTARQKDGTFIIRKGFFYTHGYTSEKWENAVKSALPAGAVVLGSGEVWKAFRGGAGIAQQSHWWVKVSFPEQPVQ